jgi:SM-20-related protein
MRPSSPDPPAVADHHARVSQLGTRIGSVIELFELRHVLDVAALEQIRREMAAARGDPATVLGPSAEQRVASSARRATQVPVSESARAIVVDRLARLRPRVAAYLGRRLDSIEEPQFVRYGPGDYFVAHQDGNTPLVVDDSRLRRVTVVIFLSAQSAHPAPETFCGGSLVLHGGFGQDARHVTVTPAAGMLVAFPAETTHEVLPITHGERLTVVSWYRSL